MTETPSSSSGSEPIQPAKKAAKKVATQPAEATVKKAAAKKAPAKTTAEPGAAKAAAKKVTKKAPAKKATVKKATAKNASEVTATEAAAPAVAPVDTAPAETAPAETAPAPAAEAAPVKKAPVKKAPVKKAPVKKAAVKKAPAKKAVEATDGAPAAKKAPAQTAPNAAVTEAPAPKAPATKAPATNVEPPVLTPEQQTATTLSERSSGLPLAETTNPVKTPPADAQSATVSATPSEGSIVHDTTPGGSSNAAPAPVSQHDWDLLGGGAHYDPHSILGAHPHDGAVTIRTMKPGARRVAVVLPDGSEHEMIHEIHGVWGVVVPISEVSDYRIKVDWPEYGESVVDDSYRFMPSLGEVDLHLIGEGRHEQLWNVLGSHVRHYSGPMGETEGTSFAVWAPNAQAVRLISDANFWNGYSTQMRSLGSSGVWEIFYPGVGPGTIYRFEILGKDGQWRSKSDPMARWTEVPPANASKVVDSKFTWHDQEYLDNRTQDHHHKPMSVYEVHLGSWRPGLGYRELATELTQYIADMGFTHVEFLPVAEHPYAPSWGYQVTGYFAPTSRFGHPDDFRYLVDELHKAGIGVIVDWVPAHFPKDEWALARFDGQPLYEYADPRRGDHPDWGTHVFDFGRREVRNFLVANAIYWLEEFHIDALRVDAVASMLYLDYSRKDGEWAPNQYGGREHLEAIDFLQEATATCYKRVPGSMMIAEESTAWPGVTKPTDVGGLGFGFKWNMGWMNDSLRYMAENPMYRQYHHSELTFSMVYAFSENYVLPISHDEVVHGKGSLLRKMPGDNWQQHANVRAFLAYMWGHPGKKLLFMGSEFAQSAEWNETNGLDWWLLEHLPHRGTQELVRDLNKLYQETPALWERDHEPVGFEWIDADDYSRNVLSFLRYDADRNPIAVIINFAGSPHGDYRLGLPFGGEWDEVLNTDAEQYGGSGVGNLGVLEADDTEAHGRPASVVMTVPPLGAVFLKPAANNPGLVEAPQVEG